MRPKYTFIFAVFAGLLASLLIALTAAAQTVASPKLDTTLITADGAFQVSYPSAWEMEERPDGALDFTADGVFGTIYPPTYLATGALFEADFSSAAALLQSFIDATEQAGLLEFTAASTVTLSSGAEAARGDFLFTQSSGGDADAQFMLSVPFDETFALILVTGDDPAILEATIYAMADSFVALESTPPPSSPSNTPQSRADLRGSADEVIEQLIQNGHISEDGEMVHEADFITTSVGGVLYLPEESESTYANFAGGALTSFRPDQDDAICGIIIRAIMTGDDFTQFLFIGIDANYDLLVLDYSAENGSRPVVTQETSDVSFFNPHYLHYVLRDGELTVFVDGDAVISGLETSLPLPDRRGRAAASLVGAELELSCVMTEYWAYGFVG